MGSLGHEQTGGEGVDLVVEVGGAGTIARSLRSLRVGGMIAQVGVLSESSDPKPFSIASLLHKQVHIQGIYVGSRSDFIAFNKAISLASLRPVYGSFPWSQVREALTLMEQGGHFGKIVLTVD
jgi:NADPH:quinone reductase-like Zn-dependent oxidoreductase